MHHQSKEEIKIRVVSSKPICEHHVDVMLIAIAINDFRI
jgi:hypothetical protein